MPTTNASHDGERLLAEMRPELHRYCARMVGSVVDCEDVVQDTLMKASAARDSVDTLDNPRAWLFRIAHNTALDFLRRTARAPIMETEGGLDVVPAPERPDPDVVSASLRSFMRLPTLQRASVIRLSDPRLRLGARDARRDVALDLVAHFKQRGKRDVGGYFTKYAEAEHWAYAPGILDGRPAMLVYDRRVSLETPAYFVALEFDGGRVSGIRDFLFARYAMEVAELQRI